MIRLIQRTLIIPRGDTGFFTIPQLVAANSGDVAVFTIFDAKTHTKIFDKQVEIGEDVFTISFTHFDTVNLPVGKFKWDIKFYQNPVFVNNELMSGTEVNSYYSAFTLPDCEIRQTGDRLLTADDAPITTLSPMQLNVLEGLLTEIRATLAQTQSNVSHYPKIVDSMWYVWDATNEDWVNTGIYAEPPLGEYVRHDELVSLTSEEIENITE